MKIATKGMFSDSGAARKVLEGDLVSGIESEHREESVKFTDVGDAIEAWEVAQEDLRPDGLVVMVVGDASQFDTPLEEFGEVVRIELEDGE